MIKKIIFAIFILFPASNLWASSFNVNLSLREAAKILHKEIPNLSYDGLFEAKRKSLKWKYSFRLALEKINIPKIEIFLKSNTRSETSIKIQIINVYDMKTHEHWLKVIQRLFSTHIVSQSNQNPL